MAKPSSSKPSSSKRPVNKITVVKVGSSSVTTAEGAIDEAAIAKLAREIAELAAENHHVVIVTSGAIAIGLALLKQAKEDTGSGGATLRAASAVGQPTIMHSFVANLSAVGLLSGQVLLAPTDFMFRSKYLKSRGTIRALLAMGVVPVINENDAVADDEIRFGDNDRLAALVAHLVEADKLVLLTDTEGLFTADPKSDAQASLITEIEAVDQELEAAAGGTTSGVGRGGMASKLAAAKIATWSGVDTVIAHAQRPNVLLDAARGVSGFGTRFKARERRLPAKKLWIAFGLPTVGQVTVDDGAHMALTTGGKSLLPAGIVSVTGQFEPGDAAELLTPSGRVFAKAEMKWSSTDIADFAGRQTSELRDSLSSEVVHRSGLVVLPD